MQSKYTWGVTKYKVLQSTRCYKVHGVAKYKVLQSTGCYKVHGVAKYKVSQSKRCYKVNGATKYKYKVLQSTRCRKAQGVAKYKVLQSTRCYKVQGATTYKVLPLALNDLSTARSRKWPRRLICTKCQRSSWSGLPTTRLCKRNPKHRWQHTAPRLCKRNPKRRWQHAAILRLHLLRWVCSGRHLAKWTDTGAPPPGVTPLPPPAPNRRRSARPLAAVTPAGDTDALADRMPCWWERDEENCIGSSNL